MEAANLCGDKEPLAYQEGGKVFLFNFATL
jgi:hypothetical protein